MLSVQSQRASTFNARSLAKPLPLFISMVVLVAVLIVCNYDALAGIGVWFNARSDKFYSAAFTFLAALWGASLTVWALLKSRATRYIERLYENVVFRNFVAQYERRIVYGLIVIVSSFAMYLSDLKLPPEVNFELVILTAWAILYLASVAAIFDSFITARTVLD
jgi:hypothetical protein